MTKYHFFYGGFLSQWWKCDFTIDGTTYNCAEQYMMASKARIFGDNLRLESILKSYSPKEQKSLGRQIKNFNPDIWNSVARQFVYLGNVEKFSQDPVLMYKLSECKGLLVEASPYDKIWGIGLGLDSPDLQDETKWRGTNWLGQILTEVRDNFGIL